MTETDENKVEKDTPAAMAGQDNEEEQAELWTAREEQEAQEERELEDIHRALDEIFAEETEETQRSLVIRVSWHNSQRRELIHSWRWRPPPRQSSQSHPCSVLGELDTRRKPERTGNSTCGCVLGCVRHQTLLLSECVAKPGTSFADTRAPAGDTGKEHGSRG